MKYPLYTSSRDTLRLPSGRPLDHFSVESLQSGELSSQDLGIHETVLLQQAEIATRAGFSQLAANLERAAELTRIPDPEILEIYESLRPGRLSKEELAALARRVEEIYQANRIAEFIREAALGMAP